VNFCEVTAEHRFPVSPECVYNPVWRMGGAMRNGCGDSFDS